MKVVYVAELYPLEDGTGYRANVPDVSGCVTTGRTLQETFDNMRDALAGCLCVLEDVGEPIPEPTALECMNKSNGAILALIDVDTLRYRIETDTRAVRKNVSMPLWMSSIVEQKGLNCSQLLQNAIRQQLNI